MAVNLFFTTMQLGITGSTGYILLKLLAAASGRRLNQSWRYHSLVAVSLLFVLPVYRLWALIPVLHDALLPAVSAGVSSEPAFLPVSPAGVGALSPQTLPDTEIDWGTVIERAAALWLCVAAGLVFWNIWRLLRHHRLIRQASSKVSNHLYQLALEEASLIGIHGEVHLLASPLAQSPMLVGFFHPTILLPSEQVPDNDARFILAHELTHFQRKDLWKKLLVLMVQCIHWFNPIVYLLNRDFGCWLETSCDECVVSSLNRDQRKEYGRLLVNYAPTARYAGSKLYVSLTSCRYKLKRRISTMLNSNKKSRSLLGLVLAIALVAGCLTTSALAASFVELDTNKGFSLEKLPEGAGFVTTGECAHGVAYTAQSDEMDVTPYDLTPYIKMIEAGDIEPLSSTNLPEGVTSLSDIYFTDVDGCASIDLNQAESGVSPLANCAHEYCYAHQYFIHGKAADGSCATDYYDSAVCHKCNTVWTLAYDRTVSYRVCPHNF